MPKAKFSNTWNDIPGWGKFILIAAPSTIIGIATHRQIKKLQEKKRLKELQKVFDQSNRTINVTTPSGQTVRTNINLGTVATEIHDAAYNNDPFGSTEDETRIVNIMKTVPKELIPELESIYTTLFKKNLREGLVSWLDSDEWEKIEYLFK